MVKLNLNVFISKKLFLRISRQWLSNPTTHHVCVADPQRNFCSPGFITVHNLVAVQQYGAHTGFKIFLAH